MKYNRGMYAWRRRGATRPESLLCEPASSFNQQSPCIRLPGAGGIVDGLMVVCIGRWEASRCTSPRWAHALPSCRNLDCVGTVQTTAAHSASQRWRQVRAPHAKVELELESLFKSASQRHPWPLDRMTFNNVLSNTRPLVHLTNPLPQH